MRAGGGVDNDLGLQDASEGTRGGGTREPQLGKGAGSGEGGLLHDPFSTSNSAIQLIELESFLLSVTVQPPLFYFCWVGTNWPAKQLTMLMTQSRKSR